MISVDTNVIVRLLTGDDLPQFKRAMSFEFDNYPCLLCYWAVRKLGFSATELSKKLGVSQPSVSISVKRGERVAKAEHIELFEGQKVII